LAKRCLDLVLALVLLAPAAMLCVLLAPVIALDCKASPFFVQSRVGRDGRLFNLVKLRTMAASTADVASHLAPAANITRTGFWLRRLKIDELPQLLNVLSGTMSFVGPRPCLPNQTDLIAARRSNGVLSLKPGITGPAQVAGIDMRDPQRLAMADAAYLAPWTLSRDVRLILQTATGSGRGDAIGQ
jgi:lipopolysaccharide/colanic/teichoic acid biosynthesis glycosyltransferase